MTDVRSDAPRTAPARRRIDRLLAADYLVGVAVLALSALRARRREAEQEDSDLTYRRALVRGRLEVVRAELARRTEPSGRRQPGLVARLPEVLGRDLEHERGSGRHPRVEPDVLDEQRRLEDQLLAETMAADVTTAPEDRLQELAATLEEFDSVLSGQQIRVRAVFDALSGELARRYRDGEAKVDDLLHDPGVGS